MSQDDFNSTAPTPPNYGPSPMPGYNGGGYTSPAASTGGRGFRDYLNMIRDWWFLALLVGGAAGAFYAVKKFEEDPYYQAMAVVRFEFEGPNVAPVEGAREEVLGRASEVRLADHRYDIQQNNEFLAFVAQGIENLTEEEREALEEPYEDKDAVTVFFSNKFIEADRSGEHYLKVGFRHVESEQATMFANFYALQYQRWLSQRTREINREAMRKQTAEIEELRRKVERGQLRLQEYREERNLVGDVGTLQESMTLVQNKLASLREQLNSAELAIINLENAVTIIEQGKAEARDLEDLPVVRSHPDVATRLDLIEQLESNRALMSVRYGKRHPNMIANANALELTRNELQETFPKVLKEFKETKVGQEQAVASLTEELARAEKELNDLNRLSIEYGTLARNLQSDQQLLNALIARYNEVQIADRLTPPGMTITNRAGAAEHITPSVKRTLAFSIGIFVLCFIGLPIAIEMLMGRMKSRSDVEGFLRAEYLGEIYKVRKRKEVDLAKIVLTKLPQRAYEMFRVLYSHISLSIPKALPRVFVITSAVPREGKSFVAANLAASFSKHNYRVLLMDCDLRRPTQYKNFKVEDSETGLLSFLQKNLAPSENTHRDLGIVSVEENFDLLPAGGHTEEATEVVRSEAFAELMGYLKSVYDVIVIDTPPIGVFPDALIVGEFAQHYLFIARPNKHSRGKIRGMLRRLNRSNAKVLGVVFNLVAPSRSQRYGNRDYSYEYYGKYRIGSKSRGAGAPASQHQGQGRETQPAAAEPALTGSPEQPEAPATNGRGPAAS